MLTDETLVTLSEATHYIPSRGGKRVHASSIWRWHAKGLSTRSGRRVRLEAIRLGGRVWTSVEAIERFGVALAEANQFDDDAVEAAEVSRGRRPRSRSERERLEAIRRAEDECERAGI